MSTEWYDPRRFAVINQLFSRFQRPERGWDPVPARHARAYAEEQWRADPSPAVDELETAVGRLAGRRVLDLGGGPGSFTQAFVRLGARVTWFDVSRVYLGLARDHLGDCADDVEWELGYLDEARRLGARFDLVFNRICWYYSMSDRGFARVVYDVVAPGGWGRVVTPYLEAHPDAAPGHRVRSRLNALTGIKVGHPFPTERHFRSVWHGLRFAEVQHGRSGRNVTILFRKPGAGPR